MPSAEVLTAFYDDYHRTRQYTAKLDSKVRRARRRIRRLKWRTKGRRFIDVGCNVGFAVEAARSCGFDALGVDIDAAAIDEAQRLFPACRFEQRDVADVADVESSFDVIYSSEVIEHLPDPTTFLKHLKRILAPDGVVFLTTPDMQHRSLPGRAADLIATDAIRPPEHLLYLGRKATTALLRRAGFTDIHYLWNPKPTLKVLVRG
jgi:2-polyprenyl-3-methyl-5-hydroxy-6-metoxy-1,4-benzoquinol methylase